MMGDNKKTIIQPENSAHKVTSTTPTITEYLNLPSWEQEKTIDYYKKAENSPIYKVTGYHGISIEGTKDGPCYTIHFINKNLEETTVRLSISERDLRRSLVALNSLLEKN